MLDDGPEAYSGVGAVATTTTRAPILKDRSVARKTRDVHSSWVWYGMVIGLFRYVTTDDSIYQ